MSMRAVVAATATANRRHGRRCRSLVAGRPWSVLQRGGDGSGEPDADGDCGFCAGAAVGRDRMPGWRAGNHGRLDGVTAIVRTVVPLAVLLLVMAGCAGTAAPDSQPSDGSPPPTAEASTGRASPHPSGATGTASSSRPGEAGGGSARVWRLRYLLLGHYPDFTYCDPDLYPVARGDEQSAADDWWAGTDRGSPEVQVILAHFGYGQPLTPAQRLTAYRDHKKLTVIAMTAVSGGYQYRLSTSAASGEPDQTVTGLVTADGDVREGSRRARPGGCPICLEAGTRIAIPGGDAPVAHLRPGDTVWTVDAAGHRFATTIERVVRRDTPGPHLMLRLALSDGRVLVAAGAHPAVDGTYLRQLHVGQHYDGATVVSVAWVRSAATATFDILPAGPTAAYWANGILVGSTLDP